MAARAFITGFAGPTLTPAERAFLREAEPWGCILFKRNIETPAQVSRLTASFRDAVGRNAPVLVDQEGGRVQRLGPPHWPAYPPGAAYGRLYDATPRAGTGGGTSRRPPDRRPISPRVGIDVDCLPVADVPVAGADAVIGDRAYGETRGQGRRARARRGRGPARGRRAAGAQAHARAWPRHGRQPRRLPVVETDRATLMATDFAAFRPLADLPLGMTAHVVYTAIDPIAPATTSVTMVREVIRDLIGFRGLADE